MVLLRQRQQIAIKQESTAGTAIALALGDVVQTTGDANWDPDIQMTERAVMSGVLSKRGSVPGTQAAKITWSQYLRGTTGAPGDGSNEGDFAVPFKGCGVVGADSGAPTAEQIAYTPSSTLVVDETSGAYCTVALYQDGKIYKIHGAVGNCTLTFTVGAPVLAEFEFTGVYNAPVDGAFLVPSYSAIIEPVFLDAALSVISYATAKISALSLNFGNEIAMRPYPNTTTGFFTAQIVGRKPTGSIDVEEVLASGKNWFSEWLLGTKGSITTGVFPSGGTNYNQFDLTIPKAQYTKVGFADREGIVTAPIDFEATANADAGDDEWELINT